ncbi:hypothetical protein H9Q69_002373 [Fusarium xylarioides]|uniref:Uncharacterized protein n=1 Tax=Fusarium xylarioides TaxID=221167 RepID=A0A9P7IE06_9HYPO|nr:hypothetical protein H9Q70_008809 [Fusarium xylarioides]KAG5765655.1 hypothetical protein H9Q72_006259 [Fusarium xylarioides]KAG5798573.1 hypothetical protein H9Q69_002373 [Fusarium xylarioides]KAG5806348.1 hypothetical protein H9Q71_009065 [Fusarium xylarioides]KAG5814450.1 hypothetical protein H9Q74_012259 [Fusarium xylarioides]
MLISGRVSTKKAPKYYADQPPPTHPLPSTTTIFPFRLTQSSSRVLLSTTGNLLLRRLDTSLNWLSSQDVVQLRKRKLFQRAQQYDIDCASFRQPFWSSYRNS